MRLTDIFDDLENMLITDPTDHLEEPGWKAAEV